MTENGNESIKADMSEQAVAGAGGEEAAAAESTSGDAAESAPAEERIRQLEALLDESAARARETQERLKDTHERYLRAAADFENWKKRAAREREDTVKFGTERLIKDVLPVIDNLERALAAAGSDPKTLLEGVRLVVKQFGEALAKHGVKSFSAVGQPFDPNLHEALMQQPSELPANTVVTELVKGYTLHDRLVRPAAVVVSTGQPSEGENASAS
jgi:molecular chaperone GrpE